VISKSRNVIQNGNFDVWQRGTSFAAAANAAHTADRWRYTFVSSTGVATVSQDTSPPNGSSLYDIKVACTTADATVAAGEYVYLQQRIEGTIFQMVRSKPMVLSFWVKAYQTGTFCVGLLSSGSNETFLAEYVINASATWEKKVIVIPPIPAGTWGTGTGVAAYLNFALQCGSSLGSGAVGWQPQFQVSTTNQTNLYSSTDNYFQLSQVQLEAGSSATEFEVLDPAQILATCQRYLIRVACNGIVLPVGNSEANLYVNSVWQISMRAAPTILVSDVTHFTGNDSVTAPTTTNNAYINGSLPNLVRLTFTRASGAWTNGNSTVVYGSNAAAVIGFTSEI